MTEDMPPATGELEIHIALDRDGYSNLLRQHQLTIRLNTGDEACQWIIDPLDGTTNFAHQLPFFSVSIGFVHKNKLVVITSYSIHYTKLYDVWLILAPVPDRGYISKRRVH